MAFNFKWPGASRETGNYCNCGCPDTCGSCTGTFPQLQVTVSGIVDTVFDGTFHYVCPACASLNTAYLLPVQSPASLCRWSTVSASYSNCTVGASDTITVTINVQAHISTVSGVTVLSVIVDVSCVDSFGATNTFSATFQKTYGSIIACNTINDSLTKISTGGNGSGFQACKYTSIACSALAV